MIEHPIEPTYDANSEILILGSFPSVLSREIGYFYGHPQNRFWKVLAEVFEENVPETIVEKKEFLLRNKVAVWDVIASCDIVGSSDSTIENVEVNDIEKLISASKIRRIFTNGRKASELYKKYLEPKLGIPAIYLPSTSPANASWSIEKLLEDWKGVK